ncbi:sn-glycerol-3-phosphate ABC transporter ATP-binding protein UgpC [Nordella sp. HKS 07]|uniref:ABC transporter ATP-binding protein n=1 Tax=Nordella sp. HKS 07 TaxID=2712222 RepID=UPI0013E16F7F|nr:sn-glycerol-3-phosphate ABC transporter ATP-binding protein UgpC [Nordella sp. HKS 07]QIG46498.1 sn-glycerol-3-phosphate ABC transporter ATP-binding protein UgpC [Nordella sp. HKS 07]
MARIEFEHVHKNFGDTPVLHDVTLSIESGELCVFVGPSGCGKSTLLRMVAGLETVTAGEIRLDGRRANDLPPPERNVAMVFQTYALFPHMTVAQNMGFGLKIRGVAGSVRTAKIAEVSRTLQLDGLLHRRPAQLSGGQRQRVAIGRAMLRDPAVYMFDEPLSNLDAALRIQTRLEIAKLHQLSRRSMIYVTHDQIEAMTLADRIIVLNRGRVEQVGSPMELYDQPANKFVASFIGAPAINLIDAIVTEKGLDIGPGVLVHPGIAAAPGAKVTIGIRPEHLAIARSEGEAAFISQVSLVERLGGETLIYAQAPTGGDLLILKIQGKTNLKAGERIALAVDQTHLHFFGADGNRLS